MTEKNIRAFHRPIGIRPEKIGPLPQEKNLPAETEMTIILFFNRELAKEMIDYLQAELLKSWLEIIPVQVMGPSP